MTADPRSSLEALLAELGQSLARAEAKHPPIRGPHEGYAVILEELDELWAEVKAQPIDAAEMRKEAMHVAAMGLRFVKDVCDKAALARVGQETTPRQLTVNDGGIHGTDCQSTLTPPRPCDCGATGVKREPAESHTTFPGGTPQEARLDLEALAQHLRELKVKLRKCLCPICYLAWEDYDFDKHFKPLVDELDAALAARPTPPQEPTQGAGEATRCAKCDQEIPDRGDIRCVDCADYTQWATETPSGAGEARLRVADMIEAFAESHWKRDIGGDLAFRNWKQLAQEIRVRAGLVPEQEQP